MGHASNPTRSVKESRMSQKTATYDALVIGAGVSGMYALHPLRQMGLSVRVFDGASSVGGTWWHNTYPGARVDGPGSPFYCYTFSDELMNEWDWAETQSDQPKVLAYLDYVADRLDLRRDIELDTWVQSAHYDETNQCWTLETSTGKRASAQYLICAVGALSAENRPDIPGIDDFAGECYHTGRWPKQPVSFEGKRVGVIGTGSSGIQAIPEIAREAAHVTVFQRTPQYAFPARNRPLRPEELTHARENWDAIRAQMLEHPGGFPAALRARSTLDDTPEQRTAQYEALWKIGSFEFFLKNYNDITVNEEANNSLADFVRGKIREIVDDPEIAAKLMPDHYVATKRPILDNGYFETYNRDNVTLVDLREDPFVAFDASGARTEKGEHPLDMLVLATGFDAISGSMLRLNPRGRGGVSLQEKWRDRFWNYAGLAVSGFPNLFMIHGPGSPGVLYHMPLGAERQMTWIGDCMTHLRKHGLGSIEPRHDVEERWNEEVNTLANATLFPRTDSWWTGSNIPGKPRQVSAFLGGSIYYERLAEIEAQGYEGFAFEEAVQGDARAS